MDHYVNLPSGSKPEFNTLRGHTAPICALLVSNRLLISASDDKTIVTWDLNTLKKRGLLKGHTQRVRCLALHGTTLISAGNDKKLRVWDVDSCASLKVVDAHSNWVRSVAIYEGTHCISGSRDRTVKVWEMATWALLGTFSASSDVYCVVAGNGLVYAACADAKIRIWNLRTMQKSHMLIGSAQKPTGARRAAPAVHARRWVVSSRPSAHARAAPRRSGAHERPVFADPLSLFPLTPTVVLTHTPPGRHEAVVRTLYLCAETHTLFSASEDKKVKVWDLKSGECATLFGKQLATRPPQRARARAPLRRACIDLKGSYVRSIARRAEQATPSLSGASPTTLKPRSSTRREMTQRLRRGRRERRSKSLVGACPAHTSTSIS
jgi:WD40 repeat protein